MKISEIINSDGSPINIVEGHGLAEIEAIAATFRHWMETSGWTQSRQGGEFGIKLKYQGKHDCFSGACQENAAALTKKLRQAGYNARSQTGVYVTDDPIWLANNEPDDWSHDWVVVGNVIVDVTADQFHPSNPQKYRVIMTSVNDPRYRPI